MLGAFRQFWGQSAPNGLPQQSSLRTSSPGSSSALEATTLSLLVRTPEVGEASLPSLRTSTLSGLSDQCEARSHAAGDRENLSGIAEAELEDKDDVSHKLTSLKQEMQSQSHRMSEIRCLVGKLRNIAEAAEERLQSQEPKESTPRQGEQQQQGPTITDGEIADLQAECARRTAAKDELSRKIRKSKEEAALLRRALEERQSAEQRLQDALREAESEIVWLRAAASSSSAPRASLPELSAGWSVPGGPRGATEALFRVAASGGERLHWSGGGVMGFVRAVFKDMGITVPEWEDRAWMALCRGKLQKAPGADLSLDMGEAITFARHCVEATLNKILAEESDMEEGDVASARAEKGVTRTGSSATARPKGGAPSSAEMHLAAAARGRLGRAPAAAAASAEGKVASPLLRSRPAQATEVTEEEWKRAMGAHVEAKFSGRSGQGSARRKSLTVPGQPQPAPQVVVGRRPSQHGAYVQRRNSRGHATSGVVQEPVQSPFTASRSTMDPGHRRSSRSASPVVGEPVSLVSPGMQTSPRQVPGQLLPEPIMQAAMVGRPVSPSTIQEPMTANAASYAIEEPISPAAAVHRASSTSMTMKTFKSPPATRFVQRAKSTASVSMSQSGSAVLPGRTLGEAKSAVSVAVSQSGSAVIPSRTLGEVHAQLKMRPGAQVSERAPIFLSSVGHLLTQPVLGSSLAASQESLVNKGSPRIGDPKASPRPAARSLTISNSPPRTPREAYVPDAVHKYVSMRGSSISGQPVEDVMSRSGSLKGSSATVRRVSSQRVRSGTSPREEILYASAAGQQLTSGNPADRTSQASQGSAAYRAVSPSGSSIVVYMQSAFNSPTTTATHTAAPTAAPSQAASPSLPPRAVQSRVPRERSRESVQLSLQDGMPSPIRVHRPQDVHAPHATPVTASLNSPTGGSPGIPSPGRLSPGLQVPSPRRAGSAVLPVSSSAQSASSFVRYVTGSGNSPLAHIGSGPSLLLPPSPPTPAMQAVMQTASGPPGTSSPSKSS